MTQPSYDELLTVVRDDGAALLEVGRTDLDAAVPGCPDWTVRELLVHVATIYRRVGGIVLSRAQTSPTERPPAPGDDVVEFYAEGLAAVNDALAATEADEQVWNWYDGGPAPAAWWARRMAHETLVHRIDAEIAVGQPPTPVGAALAADGVDELLEVLVPREQRRRPWTGLTGTLHLHATDLTEAAGGNGEWTLHLAPTSLEVHRGHAKADAALAGPAYSLLLVLYNRLPPEEAAGVESFGDPSIVERWREVVCV